MKINKIGVVGAGTMGSGISQVCSLNGFHVTMQDISEPLVERGLAVIEKSLARLLDREKISAEEKDASADRIKATTDLAMLSDCDLVVEAATENMDLKMDIFEQLNNNCAPSAILATCRGSNSASTLSSSPRASLRPWNCA